MGWKRLHDLTWAIGGTISAMIGSTRRKAWVTSCEALWAIPLLSISVHTANEPPQNTSSSLMRSMTNASVFTPSLARSNVSTASQTST